MPTYYLTYGSPIESIGINLAASRSSLSCGDLLTWVICMFDGAPAPLKRPSDTPYYFSLMLPRCMDSTMIKVSFKAPLAHRKMSVVSAASLLTAFLILRLTLYDMGWPTFLAVGFCINAGFVFGVIIYFYPRVGIAVSVLLILMYGFVGFLGLWLLVISLIVYFLTAFQAEN